MLDILPAYLLRAALGRYGYRRVTAVLQAAGWQVGKDWVQRIWLATGPPRDAVE